MPSNLHPMKEQSLFNLIEKKGNILFTIQDEGPGLAQEKIPVIFDQYNRQTSMKDQELSQDGLRIGDRL